MQTRHYEVVARTIATLDIPVRFDVAVHFANAMRRDNPKFKRAKFMEACHCTPEAIQERL
jgi:hypothetical protein